MTGTWFPRPLAPGDLRPLGASGELGVDELFELLTRADAHEWHERVGVSSPGDGSAKPSTRLLRTGGWVFKTDARQAERERAGPQAQLVRLVRLAHRMELWHPDKRWLLLRSPDSGQPDHTHDEPWWWPLSVCPELTTLRSIPDWPTRSRGWARMLALGLELSLRHGVGLDLGPSNFGVDPGSELATAPLWYLDDELYPALELADLAQAIVARIPEEIGVENERWLEFGEHLRALLKSRLGDDERWRELLRSIRDPPLAERFSVQRAALLTGLEQGPSPRPRPRTSTRVSAELDDRPLAREHETSSALRARTFGAPGLCRTAIIADVHSNLAALDAVIAAAEAERVDSWLFLGDAVGYGPQPNACIDRLRSLPNLLAIRGNHDHMCCFGGEHASNRLARVAIAWTRTVLGEAERRWLMALPIEHLDDGWLAVHGAPIDPERFNAYVYTLSYRMNLAHLASGSRSLCFHGHTHVPMVYRLGEVDGAAEQATGDDGREAELKGAALLINPGSVGQPRDGDRRASFAIWQRDRGTLSYHRVAYPVHRTIAEIDAVGLPEELAARLEIGR